MLIYVAGPYTDGDVALNVRKAIDAAESLAGLGYVPVIPHLSHFWHMIHAHDYEFWVDYGKKLLGICNALFLLPGYSLGAENEIALAMERFLPIYLSIREVPCLGCGATTSHSFSCPRRQ